MNVRLHELGEKIIDQIDRSIEQISCLKIFLQKAVYFYELQHQLFLKIPINI
jgi:hypothetical protein